jgi:hypothetical protein
LRLLALSFVAAACGGCPQFPHISGGGTGGDDSADETGGDPGETTGQEACPRIPEVVEEDLTVGPGCVSLDRTQIRNGATLTIEPDTIVEVEAAGYLDVAPYDDNAALVALGTAEAPIVFTSAADAPAPGDWQCIFVWESSASTQLEHVLLEYGGQACQASGNDYESMLVVQSSARSISDNRFEASSGHGAMLLGDVRSFADNSFGDNGAPSLHVSSEFMTNVGSGNAFDDPNDFIEVDTTFAYGSTGTLQNLGVPWRITGMLKVGQGSDLTIAPGTVMEMGGSSIEVFRGTMSAVGEPGNEVVFTSGHPDPAPGDWGCIYYEHLEGNAPRLEHVVIEYAGNGQGCTGADYKTAIFGPASLSLSNVLFREIDGIAVRSSDDCLPEWCDNAFEGVDSPEVTCTGDAVDCQ